jgi:hypothetical protein
MPLRSGFAIAIAVAASALLAATSAHADGTRGWGLHGRHAFDYRGLVPGAGAQIAPYGRARARIFWSSFGFFESDRVAEGLRLDAQIERIGDLLRESASPERSDGVN